MMCVCAANAVEYFSSLVLNPRKLDVGAGSKLISIVRRSLPQQIPADCQPTFELNVCGRGYDHRPEVELLVGS